MTCPCGRSPRGFAWHDLNTPGPMRRAPIYCCSMECLRVAAVKKEEPMKPLDALEIGAVAQASAAVGEYLEALGKTDLAQMTEADWHGFIGHAYTSVASEVAAVWAADVPF